MRLQSLLVMLLTLPALAGVSAIYTPDAAAAERNRGPKKIKVDAVGQAHITSSFRLVNDGDPDAPDVAYVVSEFIDFSGPAPLENPITETLVWEDAASGDQTFSSIVTFEDDAVDEAYVVHTTWYDGLGNALGSTEDTLIVEGRGAAPVSIEVLNPPNAAGDVVLLKGDLVQVDFAILCDFPWLAEDCSAQEMESDRKDRIQLMAGDGTVIDKTKRGRELSGLVLLKAKTLAAEPLVVGYLSTDTGTVTDTSDAGISVVADPTTAALVAQVAALEAQVAELQAGQTAQDEAISANVAEHLRNWESILDLQADDVILEGRITANTVAGAVNAVAIEAVRGPLIKHLMLFADEKFSARIDANAGEIATVATALDKHKQLTEDVWETFESRVTLTEGGVATNAGTILANHGVLIKHLMLFADEKISARVSQNEAGVATNAAGIKENAARHISDAFEFESSIEELDSYISGQGKAIATNTGGIATNAAGIKENAARHISDAFEFESSIEELDVYIQGQGKLVATNTGGIATNAAGIKENAARHISDAFEFESSIEELDQYISGQGKAIATNTGGIATNAAGIKENAARHISDGFEFESSIEELDSYISGQGKAIATNEAGVATNAAAIAEGRPWWQQLQSVKPMAEIDALVTANEAGVATNAAAIADGLGAPLANYAGIIRDQAVRLSGGETARMTFAHKDFVLTGSPVGEYFDGATDDGFRYIEELSIVDLTGDTADSPFEIGLTMTGSIPGIVFAAGATVAFPNVTSAPEGTEADLFGVNDDGGVEFLGRGTVGARGKFYAMLEGDLHMQ